MYGFNYQPYQYQHPAQQSADDRIWVQNETSAEAYLVAPNGFVRLWSASEPVFYEKRADANGRPYPMEVYEYKSRKQNKEITSASLTDYHTDELKALQDRIEALERKINESTESDADASTV